MIALGMMLAAAPALADVKAGADAWSRGDYTVAVREWQQPATSGDPDAQFNLGQAYRLGRGVGRDLAKAEDLFGKAAAQGHLQAADNYGLLLFDRGERARAMPYVQAAADRGDPRGQYLIGIAHFNGEFVTKDWTRAYAYMTLAQGSGLAQAAPALAQMDSHIPLAQRQSAASLASDLGQRVESTRANQLAAAELGLAPGGLSSAPPRTPLPPRAPAVTPPLAVPGAPVSVAAGIADKDTPATAGADYARPAVAAAPPPRPAAPAAKPATPALAARPAAPRAASAAPAVPRPVKPAAVKPAVPATGPWRVQLGAFGVAANADALWQRAKARPELAGHRRIDVRSGSMAKLQAGGFATREAAATACARLSRAGYTCIPTRD